MLKSKETFTHPRLDLVERISHRRKAVFEVQHEAVVEEATPLRVEPGHCQVILKLPPGLGENAPQHRWPNENCRPHVEAKAFCMKHCRLAAEPDILLEDFNLVAARSQRHG